MSEELAAAIAEALDAALGRLRDAVPGVAATARPIAVGWTTVEADRAESAIALAGGGAIGPFHDAPGDALLGARCRAATAAIAREPRIATLVVLEAATEGHLTASLARLGEGLSVVWLAREGSGGLPSVAALSSPGDGPFGRERLLLGGARAGRLVLIVDDAPGTIAP